MKELSIIESRELVFLNKRQEPYTTSDLIAEFAGIQHHTVTRLIRNHADDFEDFGVLGFEIHKPLPNSQGGRPDKIYRLNEQQATLLMTYLKNTAQVRMFKKELVRQFYAMREILRERQTRGWLMARAEGKKARRLETDAIKLFVEYAEAQGSKNPGKYYMNFTKLANQVVGIKPGDRDSGTTSQLLDLRMVENVIDLAILNEITAREEYHQAFQNIKVKVLQVAALALSSGYGLPEKTA